MAVTALAWLLLRQVDRRRLAIKIAAAALVMLPASLLLAMINQAVFAPIDQKILAQNPHPADVGIRYDTAGNILVDTPDPRGSRKSKSTNAGPADQSIHLAADHRHRDQRYFLLLAWVRSISPCSMAVRC